MTSGSRDHGEYSLCSAAGALLAGHALLGAADLGVGVGARRQLGLQLLGIGEHLRASRARGRS